MAVSGRHTEVEFRKTGTPITVARDKRARLMYYLDSMCTVLKLDDIAQIQRLRQFRNYNLTTNQEQSLITLCYMLSPDVLVGNCIFPCEEGDYDNEFYTLSAKSTQFAAVGSILIGGQQRAITKIMTFKLSWIKANYTDPLKVTSLYL